MKKNYISLRTHNIMDYVAGLVLVASPYLLGFSDITAARNVFLILGFGLIGYSALTKYEISVAKVIPLGVHMTMDVVAGVITILAPWIYGYREFLTGFQTAWHFILGLGVIGLVAFTRPRTEADRVTVPDRTVDFRKAA